MVVRQNVLFKGDILDMSNLHERNNDNGKYLCLSPGPFWMIELCFAKSILSAPLARSDYVRLGLCEDTITLIR